VFGNGAYEKTTEGIVQKLGPVLFGRSGLQAQQVAIAHLTGDKKEPGTAHSPEEVLPAIGSVERDRRQSLRD
jgi:hypothetical protein